MTWLALLLLAALPHSIDRVTDTVYDRAEIVELNLYGDPDRPGRQLVFWEQTNCGWQVIAWTFPPEGCRWTAGGVAWNSCGKTVVISAPVSIETQTPYDPEAKNRDCVPVANRRGMKALRFR